MARHAFCDRKYNNDNVDLVSAKAVPQPQIVCSIRCVAFKKSSNMTQQKIFALLLILTAIVAGSCKKINYGTSLTIQNHLEVEIELEVFPIESPYSLTTNFTIPAGDQSSFYNTGVTDKSALDLISETFDSLKIHIEGNENIVLFTPYLAINYSANPYTDIEIWESRTVEWEECSMTCEDMEDLNHFFGIDPNLVSIGN